jgi:hypothetical protein
MLYHITHRYQTGDEVVAGLQNDGFDMDSLLNSEYCAIVQGQLALVPPRKPADLPELISQPAIITEIDYLGFQNTRRLDTRDFSQKTVGFFLNDKRFQQVGTRPWAYVRWLLQYLQVLSPDFSCFADMEPMEQWAAIFLSRLVGRFWQDNKLSVIPTVTWGDLKTFEFAFKGIPVGSIVAISTMGAHTNYAAFMEGFKELCLQVQPSLVICYCRPLPEMRNYAKILFVEHEGARAARESLRDPRQLSLFDIGTDFRKAA